MNCETIPLMLSAALDGELSAADRTAMDEHLSGCASCREHFADLQMLDDTLKVALQPPSVQPVVERLLRILASDRDVGRPAEFVPLPLPIRCPDPSLNGRPASRSLARTRRSVVGTVALLICILMIAMAISVPVSEATPAVAEITVATGSIEVMRSKAGKWTSMNQPAGVSLPAHARIRTRDNSLCEIRTKSDALVRLNHETELVMHQPEQIELVSGELWCRTPATTGLEISTTKPPRQPAYETAFTCPSSCETQWQASANQELSCLAVSSLPIELRMNSSAASCTVSPGDTLTFAAGSAPERSGNANRLEAISWQLPLLILRSPGDQELRQRLTQLLAAAGRTKMAYLYEDQIRQLGAKGTLPLLAFVRSPESLEEPDLRFRAMRIIADLAPRESMPDLEALLKDNDPAVQQLSSRALQRLNHDR